MRLHLEQELVAGAAGRVAGAGLALAEHHELDAGDVQQLGDGLGRLLGAVLVGAGAADPEQVLDVVGDHVLAVDAEHADLEVDLLDPGVAHVAFMPHGLPLFSRFLNRPLSSLGNSVSIMTWWRRMSTKWSMCSMSTGHWLTQAPQVVQDHRASVSMTGRS